MTGPVPRAAADRSEASSNDRAQALTEAVASQAANRGTDSRSDPA